MFPNLFLEDKDIEIDQNKEHTKKRQETEVDTKKNSIGKKEKDLSYASYESEYESDEKVLVDNKPLDIGRVLAFIISPCDDSFSFRGQCHRN
jgi:hypothetical protein